VALKPYQKALVLEFISRKGCMQDTQ
jgi:hypothetical protein